MASGRRIGEGNIRYHIELVTDLDKILSVDRYLLSLINHVLDLSSIEAGKMQMYLAARPVIPWLRLAVTSQAAPAAAYR